MLLATHKNGKRGAFVADRRALVEQTSERFDRYGLAHGIMMADHPRFQPSQLIQVVSAQTVQRRKWPAANLIMVDECHVLLETVKAKLLARDCYAVGLSATAITKGLANYFDVVVNAPPANRMIEQGLLVPLEIYECQAPDMEGAPVKAGEWDSGETEKRALQVVGDVVSDYLESGGGEQFICFATSIAHAEELARQFLAAGVNVATYTANDQPEDRSDIVQEFKKADSSLRGLISVSALTRGFDAPQVSLLIMARPLRKACHEFIQMLGRVMRTSQATGKVRARVHDHSGNVRRFWKQMQDLFENGVTELDDGKPKPKDESSEKAEAEPVKCPSCKAIHKPAQFCPNCGHEYPKRLSVQHVPGTLKELIAGGFTKQLDRDIFPQVAAYALSRREGDAARRMAQGIYKDMTGDWAKVKWENVTPVQPTPEVIQKIRAMQLRFAKRREAAARHEAARAVAA